MHFQIFKIMNNIFKGKLVQIIIALTITFISFLPATSFAQLVYSTQYKYDADVKVYVTQYKYEADLIVYKCNYKYEVEGNKGLWYFTDYQYDAKKKIYFTDYKYDADIKVYFTSYKYEAGWVNKSKQHLFY